MRVVGRLKQDRWTDPDGKLYSRVSIVVEKAASCKVRLPDVLPDEGISRP